MLKRILFLILAVFLLFLVSCKKEKQPIVYHTDGEVVPILQNAANGVNVVILGDGYVKADLSKGGTFDSDVKTLVDYMFTIPPYSTYKNYFNVYEVCAQSAQRGAGQDSPNVNTTFNAYFTSYISRLIVTDNYAACNTYASKAVPNGNVNLIILLVNDSEYGGSGGQIAVVTTHDGFEQTVIHEIGHAFGGLGDEYVDETVAPYYSKDAIPLYPNLDTTADPAKIKWGAYFNLPAYQSVVGAYEGGYYASTGVYRPEFTSIMRDFSLIRYNAPSREAIARRIFSIIGKPFDMNDFLLKDKTAIQPGISIAPNNNNRLLPLRDFINAKQRIMSIKARPDL